MKPKKQNKWRLALLLMAMAGISCSNDDIFQDEENSSNLEAIYKKLEGRWECYKVDNTKREAGGLHDMFDMTLTKDRKIKDCVVFFSDWSYTLESSTHITLIGPVSSITNRFAFEDNYSTLVRYVREGEPEKMEEDVYEAMVYRIRTITYKRAK